MAEVSGSLSADPLAGGFNRGCRWVAFVWLLAIPVTDLIRPADQDFCQFYMGGLVARTGQWESLYPVPLPGSSLNAGWPQGATMKPGYEDLARRYSASTVCRFMQSPPTALLLAPLSFVPYRVARRLWMALNALCVFGVALQAAGVWRLCTNRSGRVGGVLVLVIAISPLAYRAVRVGNASPMIAYCLGVVVLDLARGRAARGAVGMWVGAALKYATIVLLPLAVVRRNWRLLAGVAMATAVVVSGFVASKAWPACREFWTSIVPTLSRSSPFPANRTVQGLILRLTGREALAPAARQWLAVAGAVWVGAVLVLVFVRRGEIRMCAVSLFAAAAALLTWMLIFAPLAWEHYAIYLCPLWGWLFWEAAQSRGRCAWVVFILASHWVPLPDQRWIKLSEPLNSYMLFGTVAMCGLAVWRVFVGPSAEDVPARRGAISLPSTTTR